MRRTWAILAATAALAAAGGCGGGDDEPRRRPGPTVVAPLSETIEQWERAVRERSCRLYAPTALTFTRPEQAVPGGPPVAGECDFYERQMPAWRGIDLRDTERFGTAAIAQGPGPRRAGYTNHTAIFILDWDRRYRFWGTSASDPQIGTQPGADTDFAATARDFVRAVREHDCRGFLRVAMPGGDFFRGTRTPQAACRAVLGGRNLAPQLRADPDAEPVELGTTSDLGFYGVATQRNYYTLVLGTRPTGAPSIEFRGKPNALVLNYFPNYRPAN